MENTTFLKRILVELNLKEVTTSKTNPLKYIVKYDGREIEIQSLSFEYNITNLISEHGFVEGIKLGLDRIKETEAIENIQIF